MNIGGSSFVSEYTAPKNARTYDLMSYDDYIASHCTSEELEAINAMKRERLAYYEASRDTYALVISDDGRMLSEWEQHFRRMFHYNLSGVSGSVFDEPHIGWPDWQYSQNLSDDFFTSSANIYMKIRGDIDMAYGGDPEKHKLFMLALDDAFQRYIDNSTNRFASVIPSRIREGWAAYVHAQQCGPTAKLPKQESPMDPIARHKDFNAIEFGKSLTQMGRDFVAAFTQGAKFGLAAAWENVDRLLGGMETTSVNNWSYNDFRIIMAGLSGSQITSRTDTWAGAFAALGNNTNLSGYMRDVFQS